MYYIQLYIGPEESGEWREPRLHPHHPLLQAGEDAGLRFRV